MLHYIKIAHFNSSQGFAAHMIKTTFPLLKYMQRNTVFAPVFDCQLFWTLAHYKC